MLSALFYGVCAIVGFFGIKLIFWDVPKYFDHYWKGVGVAVGGMGLIYLYAIYPILGIIVTVLIAVSIFLIRAR